MKPCFACGGGDVGAAEGTDSPSWRVSCRSAGCRAAGPVRESAEAAELAWNAIQRACPFAREVVGLLWAACRNAERTSTVGVVEEFSARVGKGVPVHIGVDRIKLAIDELEVEPWPTKQGPRP